MVKKQTHPKPTYFRLTYGDSGNCKVREALPTTSPGVLRIVEKDRDKVVRIYGSNEDMISLALRILGTVPVANLKRTDLCRFAHLVLAMKD